MVFGKEILNGKQLREVLGISTTIYYQLLKNGMPFHQLTTGSKNISIFVKLKIGCKNLDIIGKWFGQNRCRGYKIVSDNYFMASFISHM